MSLCILPGFLMHLITHTLICTYTVLFLIKWDHIIHTVVTHFFFTYLCAWRSSCASTGWPHSFWYCMVIFHNMDIWLFTFPFFITTNNSSVNSTWIYLSIIYLSDFLCPRMYILTSERLANCPFKKAHHGKFQSTVPERACFLTGTWYVSIFNIFFFLPVW